MTTETDYWCRLALTIDQHGGDALSDVLHDQPNGGLPTDSSAVYVELDTKYRKALEILLKKNKIKQDQWDLLFPSDYQTHIDKFDITLKVLLIKNCTNVFLKKDPKATFVDQIRKLRNDLMHYSNYRFMSEDDFDKLWNELSSCLVGLDYTTDISYMKTKILDQNEKKKILELEKEQKEIHDELESLDTRITEHDDRLLEHDDRLTEHDDRLTEHDNRILEHDDRLTEHDDRITEHDDRITEHDDRLLEHDDRLTEHDDRITEHDDRITEHDDRITEHDDRITEHDDRLIEHDDRITEHDDRLIEHDDRITEHDDRITEHDDRLTEHDDRITEHDDRLNEHDDRLTALEKKPKGNEEDKEVDPCKKSASNDAECIITSNYRNKQDDVILHLTSYHPSGIPVKDDRIDKILLLSKQNYVLRISKIYSNELQNILSSIYKEQEDIPVPHETYQAEHSLSGHSIIGTYSHTSVERYHETSTYENLENMMVVAGGQSIVVTPAAWEKDCLRYLNSLSHDERNVFTESIEVFTEPDTQVQNLVKKFKGIQKRLLPDAFIGGYNPIEHYKFLYDPFDETTECFQNFLVVLRQEPFEILCFSMTFSNEVKDVLIEIQKGCRRVELVAKANNNVVKSFDSKPSIYNIIVAPEIETVTLNQWCCKHCLVVPKEIYNDDTKMKEYFDDLPKCGLKKRCKENYKKLVSSIIGFVATNAENKTICNVTSHDLIKYTRLTNQQQDILSSFDPSCFDRSSFDKKSISFKVIIQGDYGSGKTIVGLFLLKKIVESAIERSHVWYVVFRKSEILLKKIQNNLNKFFPDERKPGKREWRYTMNSGSTVDISVCFAEDIEGTSSTVAKLSSVIRTLQNLHPNDLHHFIIDEYDGESLDSNEAKSLKEVSNESYIVVLVQALEKYRTYDDGKLLQINHDKFKYSETGMTVYEPLKTAMRNPKQIHELITAAKQSISSLENVFSYNDIQKKERIPILLRLKNFFSLKPKHKTTMTATQYHSSNKDLSKQPNEVSTSFHETQKTRSVYPQQDFDAIASELHNDKVKGGVKTTTKMLYHKSRLGNKIECEKSPVFVSFNWKDDSERFSGLFIYFQYHFFKHHETTALFICDNVKHQTIYKKILEFVGKKHILLNDSDQDEYYKSCQILESNEKGHSILCNTRSSSGCEYPNVVVCVHPEEHHLRHHFVDNVSRCTSHLTMVCLSNYNPTTSDLSDTTLHYVVKDLQRKNLFKFIPLEFDDSLESWQNHSFDEKSLTTFKINRNSDEFIELCKKSLESSPIKKNLPTRSELLNWMTVGSPINTKKDEDGDNDGVVGAEAENDGNKITNADEDGGDDGVVGAEAENDGNKITNANEDGGDDGVVGADEDNDDNKATNVSSDFDSYTEADIKQLILNSNIEKLKSLSSQWPNVIIKNLDNQTPLIWASLSGDVDVVKILIDSGANVHVGGSNNRTPLHYASLSGDVDIVKILIDSGANVHVGDSNNETPLHHASLSGHADIVKILIDSGANVHVGDSDNRTPLHYASFNGYVDIVKILIDSGANVHVGDSNNETPLHHASLSGDVDVVKILINSGANVHVGESNNRTPLHSASLSGDVDVVKILIESGANVHVGESDNETPLHVASWYGYADVVAILKKHGAVL